jgi:hypothetical protein
VEKANAVLANQAPERPGKSAATDRPVAPKAQPAGPSVEQTDLREGWNHVVRGGRVVKATNPPPNPNPSPQPVTEALEQPKVTTTRKTTGPKKPEPKSKAAAKPAAGKSKKAASSVKTVATKPIIPELVVPTQSSASPLEEISDLLDHLPIQACVELTRRVLTSLPSLPKGTARPRAVLKTVIPFVAEYGSTP